MMIFLGSDHAGFELKEVLREQLKAEGHSVVDVGCFSAVNKVDYPDIAREVAEKVRDHSESRGILVCGTGIGISIAANKVRGIRAANVHDTTEARLARQHNDANIVAVGQRTTGFETAKDIVTTFLSTAFESGRHSARVEKIKAIEDEQ